MSKAIISNPPFSCKVFLNNWCPRKLEAKKVYADNKLLEDSVIRNFRITAAGGKTYDTEH